jgi:ligand-binding sensor domain-containing protein
MMMKLNDLMFRSVFGLMIYLMYSMKVFAGAPLFTFTPLTGTSVQVSTDGTAFVEYVVKNQSQKAHTLVVQTVAGITQLTHNNNCGNPFVLEGGKSCVLSLQINGDQITGNTSNALRVCQQKSNGEPNPLMCYQPSLPDLLRVTVGTEYLYVGGQNGNFYFSIDGGFTWILTTVPAGGSAINSIFATALILYVATQNGIIYYSSNQGASWTSTTAPDGSPVEAIFVSGSTLYAGTATGNVLVSQDNGVTWTALTQPDGTSVNAVFVTNGTIYVGTTSGFVYYSPDNGLTWVSINGSPDGSSIKNVTIINSKIYVSTADEYVYSSTALTGGGSWTWVAQSTYSIFASQSNNVLYGGSQSGYVFSITAGTQLGFVDFTPINSIFALFS